MKSAMIAYAANQSWNEKHYSRLWINKKIYIQISEYQISLLIQETSLFLQILPLANYPSNQEREREGGSHLATKIGN